MKKNTQSLSGADAVSVVGSIFRVRRDLVGLIKENVIQGSGLSLEEADVLLDIYGATKKGWHDPKATKDGWVTFASLKKSLVHSAELLSRRIGQLEDRKCLESRRITPDEASELSLDAKSKKVRLLPAGEEKGREIYDRYCQVCEKLLAGFSVEDLRIVLQVNQELMKKLNWRVTPERAV